MTSAMSDAAVLWTKKLSGSFYGATASVGPGWLALMVVEDATPGVVGFNNEGDVQWRVAPTTRFEADDEFLWFGGSRRMLLLRASDGTVSAERGFPEGVSAVKPGVARIGDIAQGKLIGLEANLSTLWEWSEMPGAWSVTSKYLCGLREGFSHTVSLPQLVRRKIPVSIAGRGGLSFEYADVIAHVAVSDGESCGVSIEQESEVWRRVVEPRGLARKWGDSFLFYGERLQRVEILTGKTIWEFPLESQLAQARVVGDEIFLATVRGKIQVVDCRTGEMTFDARLPADHKGRGPELPHVVLPCGPENLFVVTNTMLYCVARSSLG